MISQLMIPMDGSMTIFSKQDMLGICVKSWNTGDAIRTAIYRSYTVSKPDTAISTSNILKLKIGLSGEVTEAFTEHVGGTTVL